MLKTICLLVLCLVSSLIFSQQQVISFDLDDVTSKKLGTKLATASQVYKTGYEIADTSRFAS